MHLHEATEVILKGWDIIVIIEGSVAAEVKLEGVLASGLAELLLLLRDTGRLKTNARARWGLQREVDGSVGAYDGGLEVICGLRLRLRSTERITGTDLDR